MSKPNCSDAIKGVELLHSNQVSNIKAGREMVVNPADFIQAKDRSLAFLPWAHSYGQVSEFQLME
jgi:long-chain acyl-CoA synthetase